MASTPVSASRPFSASGASETEEEYDDSFYERKENGVNKRGRFQFKFDPPTSNNGDFSFDMPSSASFIIEEQSHEVVESNTESDEEFEVISRPFDNMTIKEYGRGYLVKCPDDHPDKGKKYFHNGWWQECNQAWFIKKELKDFFIENGAVLIV